MTWRDRAEAIICDVLAKLPKDADEDVCRRAIEVAYPWDNPARHPRRAWSEVAGNHLRQRFPQTRPPTEFFGEVLK